MTDPGGFPAHVLERLRTAKEVRVETRSSDGVLHRTIIWVVVDDAGRVLARSYRGAGARWYREALSGRPVAIDTGHETLPVRVEPAIDPDRIASCSVELERKYAGDPATPAMVRPEVLDTTIQLHPS
jgi:hypothetical protein